MRQWIRCWVLLLVGMSLGMGCGQSDRAQAEQAVEELSEMGQQLAEASEEVARSMEKGGEGLSDAFQNVQKAVGVDGDVDPIDFRELKSALPTELNGFTAGKAIGERTRIMGIGSSKAEVRLSSETGSILVRITDTGSAAGWAALAGRAAGAFAEVERETEHGFERSGMVDGMPTQESHDSQSGNSRMHQFYGDRFALELQGRNVQWEDMTAAREAIDRGRLDELKGQSTETAQAAGEE